MKATFRIILTSAIAALFLFSTTPAQADSGERIFDYLVDVEITADGRTLITEEITYDFGYSDKHGIFRSIPMWDDLPNDLRRTYHVTIDSVLMDGNAVVVEEIEEDPFLTLKIGSPDFTVSGTHTYEISYVISNALTVLTQKDVDAIPNNTEVKAGDVEFYWDVIGSEWQVPIDSAVISISTKSAPLITDCYAETECTRETGPAYTTFSVVSISEQSPVTVVITQSRSAFTSVNPAKIGAQPDSWAEQFVRTALFGLAIAVVLVFLIIRWAKRRAITIQTVKVFDFVRFEPPMGLSVAEVAAAWHGGFSTRALTASLVQMAADGVVELDSTNGELTVIVKDESKAKIPWQQQLVHAISPKGSPAHLTEYDKDFASSVNATGSALVAEAEQKGILNPKANRSRIAMIVGIAISVASLIFVMPMVAAPQIFGFVFLIPIAGFIGFAIGYRITPKVQTEKSAEFLSAVAGFEKLFTTDAAAARREFAHRSGLTPAAIFATLLPFAIIYEAEASWVGAFPDITPDELRAYGYNVASMGAMTSLTQNTEAALSAAMTSPSSSGSGSGGGSAGGGGGGGGGGSW